MKLCILTGELAEISVRCILHQESSMTARSPAVESVEDMSASRGDFGAHRCRLKLHLGVCLVRAYCDIEYHKCRLSSMVRRW